MRHGTRDTDKILRELPDFTKEEVEEFVSAEKRQQVRKIIPCVSLTS